MKILKVENLKVSAFTSDGERRVIDDLSFDLEKGKSLAIVGGKSSGKTVTALSLFGTLPKSLKLAGGRIYFLDGRTGSYKSSHNGEFIRSHARFVPKDPNDCFDAKKPLRKQFKDAFLTSASSEIIRMRLEYTMRVLLDSDECTIKEILPLAERVVYGVRFDNVKRANADIVRVLSASGIDSEEAAPLAEKISAYCCRSSDKFADEYLDKLGKFIGLGNGEMFKHKPNYLTMDVLKLASIAFALIQRPELLVLDEPVAYVGAVAVKDVLSLLARLKRLGITLIVFTRNYSVAEALCDEICVIYRGRVCEKGRIKEVFEKPSHEYTKAMLKGADELALSPNGDAYGFYERKAGCQYAYNCSNAGDVCGNKQPIEIKYTSRHCVYCWTAYRECMQKGYINIPPEEITISQIDLSNGREEEDESPVYASSTYEPSIPEKGDKPVGYIIHESED